MKRKLLLLLLALALLPAALLADIAVPPGVSRRAADRLSWAGFNQVWLVTPETQEVTLRLHFVNRSSAAATFTLRVYQSPDPNVANWTDNQGFWEQDNINGGDCGGGTFDCAISLAATSTESVFINTFFANKIAIRITGAAATGGTPDSGDFWIVQRPQTISGTTLGSTSTVVTGPAASGSALAGNPVRMGGSDGTNVVNYRTATQALTAFNAGLFPAQVYATDGTNSRAVEMVVAGVDGRSNSANLLMTASRPELFNGTTWDRDRSVSLANFPVTTTMTGRNSIGAALAEKGSRWSVVNAPATGTIGSASIAAEAGVRHVADCISFSATSTTAPALTGATVTLRDGATGAGVAIWAYQVIFTASAVQHIAHSFCGLNLVGTTNTAMTLEFNAGVANVSEATSLSGYNVN